MKDKGRAGRWIASIVVSTGVLLIAVDTSIVNVALPALQRGLGFTPAGLSWVMNGYLIAFGGLMILCGRLGDLIGRRTVFVTGLVVFVVASGLVGVSPDSVVFVVARFVQGIGGAMAMSVSLGIIATLFPDERERAQATVVYTLTASAGSSLGMLLGGVITHALGWRWVFFVNVPAGAIVLLLTFLTVSADRGQGLRRGADVLGAVLATSAVMLAVYTIVGTADHGWASARTIGFGAVSLLLLAGLAVRLATATNPLIPLRLLRSRTVVGANVMLVLTMPAVFALNFFMTLYLQDILGFDAIRTGVAFLPATIAAGVMPLFAVGRLVSRFGLPIVLFGGLAVALLGLLLLTQISTDGRYVIDVLPGMIVLGVGTGTAFAAGMTLAMSTATTDDPGAASGLSNTSAQVGGALGLGVFSTAAATYTAHAMAEGQNELHALVHGYQLGFWIAAVFIVVAITVAILALRPSHTITATSESDAQAAGP